MEQGIEPAKLAKSAAIATVSQFGSDASDIKNGLKEIWPSPWANEHEQIYTLILNAYNEFRFSW